MDIQQLTEEQELILSQVDNAIALFNRSQHLVLFNQKLAHMWGLSVLYLKEKPHFTEVFTYVVKRGYWSRSQYKQLREIMETASNEGMVLDVEQVNGVYLEVYTTVISNGGRLFTFRDVTRDRQALLDGAWMQANLNAEVKRLRFLLGLNERMQNSEDLEEIAQFALNYLMSAMNAAFGDVKVINGEGEKRQAAALSNQFSSQFISTYGSEAIAFMSEMLRQGIPYGEGLLWSVVETGKPLFVEDYYQHPQAVAAFHHPGIGQVGIFPIPAEDGKIIGVLTLESRSLQKLQEEPDQEMLLAACRALGVAIERAQAQAHLRRMNEYLERASQLKSEFLASMSHELRTPLNSILGFSDLLLRQGTNLTERQVNYATVINNSGKHLLDLINDILDLSKIEAGKTQLDLQMVSVHTLCHDCLAMIQPRATQKRLTLSVEVDSRLDKVLLDDRRTRQILINLLSNAVKFTPEAGSVALVGCLAYGAEIGSDNRPDRSPINPSTPYLCLEVEDSGIGIPESKWHLLFHPFQQVDSSLTRRHDGTGLGLALTKRLAELHGGTVSFQSTEGVGSIFRVWLPLTEMRHSFKSQSEATDRSYATLKPNHESINAQRVLVIEDQPYNQALISEMLELSGYVVELICDGKSMSLTISSPLVTPQTLPDLILMDIQLPEVDGLDLIRQLKAHSIWQQVPVVAITAMAMPGDRDRCLAAGADAYLSKPLDFDKVIATLKSLLDSCQ
ncbi:MAG: ATP-binding protein [Hormoscilla sp.]